MLVARGKPPAALVKAVENAGGDLRVYEAPKPWKLPGWVEERGRELGLQVDGEAAKRLVSLVGTSQQRLARELEKLALALHPRRNATIHDVEQLAAADTALQAYDLADAIVAGDLRASLALAQGLEAHGSARVGWRSRSSGGCGRCTEPPRCSRPACPSGRLPNRSGSRRGSRRRPWRALAMPTGASLERALGEFADLEIELRGGGELQHDEATRPSLALARSAG